MALIFFLSHSTLSFALLKYTHNECTFSLTTTTPVRKTRPFAIEIDQTRRHDTLIMISCLRKKKKKSAVVDKMYAAIMGAQDLNVNIVLSLWKTKILIPIVGPSRPTGKSIHPSTLLLNYWWVRKKIKSVSASDTWKIMEHEDGARARQLVAVELRRCGLRTRVGHQEATRTKRNREYEEQTAIK